MDRNPLIDIADKAKQQHLDNNLNDIKVGIQYILKEIHMPKLIELTTGVDTKILVNPEHIISIIPTSDQRSWVNVVTGEQYKVLETKDEIMKLVNADTTPKYIS